MRRAGKRDESANGEHLMLRGILVVAFMGYVLSATAQDKPTPPIGRPPEIMFAQAFEKDQGVVVKFTSPVMRPKSETIESDVGGKKSSITRMVYSFEYWREVDIKIDGKSVKAFDVAGKEIAAKKLPTMLKTNTRVAVMLGTPGTEPKLDMYYLQTFKDDMVVFTIPMTTFYPPQPPK